MRLFGWDSFKALTAKIIFFILLLVICTTYFSDHFRSSDDTTKINVSRNCQNVNTIYKQSGDLLPSVYGDDTQIMLGNSTNNQIPPILHVQWKSYELSKKHTDILLKWRQFHPNWVIMFWTDESMNHFVNDNLNSALANFYYKLPKQIYRIDFMRYIIMHHFGGVYADMDVEPLQSLEPLMNYHSCVIARELEPNAISIGIHRVILASNFLLMSRSRHPVWNFIIEYIQSIKADHPIHWTGPVALTEALQNYETAERLRPQDSSVFLAPSLYFSSPYPPTGDSAHLASLRNARCPDVVKSTNKNSTILRFHKRICRIFLKEHRIDYSDAYLHPRHFKEGFTRHHMTGTWFRSSDWATALKRNSVFQAISNVVVYGVNGSKKEPPLELVSAFNLEKIVMERS